MTIACQFRAALAPIATACGALVAVLALVAATGAHAADWDVAALFDRLARERPARAQFRERKYLALLAEPVESSGELTFTPPDRLEKRTLLPKPETLVVEGTRLSLERDGRRQVIDLAQNPRVAVLIDSIRGTLAGDLAGLSREYALSLDGDATRWRLTLRPTDASLAPLVERIEIGGAAASVRTVEIFQADGDHSVMTISAASAR